MNPVIVDYVARLAAFNGIKGCSVVDAESGLVLESAGDFPDVVNLSEAAVEFWRVHARQNEYFEALGELSVIMLAFKNGWLGVTSCAGDPSLLIVAVTRNHAVDWQGWLKHARTVVPTTC
jgi:hypothetical protein